MGAAAIAVAREAGYVGAGTVEFIVDPSGRFYFLEVNTRLQVEHPVTEAVYGIDLVREQLRVARGERLGYDAAPAARGWAIEVRLCAEDPAREYLPTTGALLAVDVPGTVHADLGVVAGSDVSIHYDSMLGKLIAHAPTRREAAQVLARALDDTWLPGVTTNRAHLARILAHAAFVAGELDTHFLERHAGELAAPPLPLDTLRVATIAAIVHGVAARRPAHALAPPGWRNVRFAEQRVELSADGADVHASYRALDERAASPPGNGALDITIGGKTTRVAAFGVDGDRAWMSIDGGHRRRVRIAVRGDRAHVLVDGRDVVLEAQPRFAVDHGPHRAVEGGLVAPMPGKVVKVLVAPDDAVAAGAPLVVLEAMKMEHTVRATSAGVVRAIHVAVGDQVDADRLLAVVS
jgi:propionyl-CoA carboxylase alpha chain